MADMIAEIKKSLKDGMLVIGKDETLKGIRTAKFSKVYLASNCPENLKEDITRYASMDNVEVVQTEISNSDLGDICKKPFWITVMGLKKQK